MDLSISLYDRASLMFSWAGYALQAVGLQYTSASRSGFLLYLNVKLVPLFAFILLGRKVTSSPATPCAFWEAAVL
jgi:drug/metabolite transporter (DMT)-like permease